MKKIAEKIIYKITNFLENLVGIIISILVIIVFGEVVMRYFFNSPQPWSSELARFLLIWLTFCGASVATIRGTHLSTGLTLYSVIKNKKIIVTLKIIVTILVSSALFIIGYYGMSTMLSTGGRIAPMTGIQMYYPWSAMPFNLFLMVIFVIFNSIKEIATIKEGEL